MRRAYFKTLFVLYVLALVLCVGSRCVLSLYFTDFSTGLYNGGEPLVLLFNLSLGIFIAAWFLMTLLRRASHEYPLGVYSRVSRVFSALCGIAILGCTALAALEVWDRWRYGIVPQGAFTSYLHPAFEPTAWTLTLLGLKLLTGVLGALAMLMLALRHKPAQVSFWGIFPPIWQILILLERFTDYLSPTQISENLLFILFMALSPLFLLGQSRAICGIGFANSRAYLIPAGLSASLVGFCICVPKLVLLARSGEMPYFDLSWMLGFQIYMMLLSVYMAFYLYGYVRAIKIV